MLGGVGEVSGRCRGGVGLVLGRCRGGVSGWVEEVGVGCVRGACVGRACGVRGACLGCACLAISVSIARSALLSGYLGKSGHLIRYFELVLRQKKKKVVFF